MARKKKHPTIVENVTIENVAAEGKAIARVNGKVVFVSGVAPGDVVDLQIVKRKKNFIEGQPVAFHRYSEMRIEPFCQHFGICGGCKWQHLPYEKQAEFKQQQVIDQLERIGHLELPEIKPIMKSERTRFYRNKLEFTFSNRRWLEAKEIAENTVIENMNAVGFHIPRMYDKVLDIETCYLQPDPSNDIRNFIRTYALKNDISFFDLRHKYGLLRNLIIRITSTGEIMVILVVFEDRTDIVLPLLDAVYEEFPNITSVQYVVNPKRNDSINDLEAVFYKGNDHIVEQLENLEFKIGPKSFYQTNSWQAVELYKVIRNFAQLTGTEIVYDLYTGTGTIANFLAEKAAHVIGVEQIKEAIDDALINSEMNRITNTTFAVGDMKDVFSPDFVSKHGRADVVIMDPPRAGMHKNVISTLLAAAAPRMVYVSCNPATQARDIEMLSEKYAIKAVQPVDMFPHTHHVENVVLLELK